MRGLVIHLQTDPEALGHSEETREPQAGVGSHPTSARNDLADPTLWHPDFLGETVLRDPHRLQKLLEENLARVRVRDFAHGSAQLVVINYFNIFRHFSRPPEAHAELVIDADAVPSGQIALQGLQSVSGRSSEVIKPAGTVEHGQFTHCHGFDVDEALDSRAFEQALGVGTFEGPDRHGK
jgi:hypothetical protein